MDVQVKIATREYRIDSTLSVVEITVGYLVIGVSGGVYSSIAVGPGVCLSGAVELGVGPSVAVEISVIIWLHGEQVVSVHQFQGDQV